MHDLFTSEDLKKIESAVADAEGRTSGEIVPYVVDRAGRYPAAYYRAGAVGAIVGLTIALVLSLVYDGWGLAWLFTPGGTGFSGVIFAVVFAALARTVSSVERLFAGPGEMAFAVRDRSVRAFVEEEVFDTRERTGILLFIALFERRVEVVGDSGINARVDAEEWAYVVRDVLEGIRSGKAAEGMVSALERCGKLLEKKGVEIREDDENELSDSVRFGSE